MFKSDHLNLINKIMTRQPSSRCVKSVSHTYVLKKAADTFVVWMLIKHDPLG